MLQYISNRKMQIKALQLFWLTPRATEWETRWPHGYCARLRIERSGFEPWPGTLFCFLGQDTLLSQCLSPPRRIKSISELSAWGNPAVV